MADDVRALSLILDLVRSGRAVTRPELMRATGLGRTIITQRVSDAIDAGILQEEPDALSTGGRPSRVLGVRRERGAVLAAVFGASRVHIAISDISGRLLNDSLIDWDIELGPTSTSELLLEVAGQLMKDVKAPLWAATVGLPGPVDFSAGKPVNPPIMAGWHSYPLRNELQTALGVPVWIDNDVNLMALGTWRHVLPVPGENILLVKIGTGIGAGLISHGRLHRGARGGAGDFGHTIVSEASPMRCRCGNYGCLEAIAGGWALARDALRAARAGGSPYLRDILAAKGKIGVADVVQGSNQSDPLCLELVARSGVQVGTQLGTLVSFFNPSTVYIAGSLADGAAIFMENIRDGVMHRAPALATEELTIAKVDLGHYEGVLGATQLAIDELFHAAMLERWIGNQTPHGVLIDQQPLNVTRTARAVSHREALLSLTGIDLLNAEV